MSVVLPVRDEVSRVAAAIGDLAAQTLADIEIVVVDDGSTDGTDAVLASVDDPRVRVLHGAGTGLVDALRLGMDAARGAYVARMDADDRCHPDRLARQAAVLDAHPAVVVVGSAFAVVDDAGVRLRVEAVPVDDAGVRRSLWVRNPYAHGSVMIRRSAYDDVGGYRADRPAAEDYDLWCRLAATGRLAAVPEVLYEWRQSPTATSAVRAHDQRTSTAAILAERWADGLPPLLDRRALAEAYAASRRHGPAGADERADELELAVVRGLAARGHRGRAVTQLAAFLASRPGAVGAAAAYVASGGRVTRAHRILGGLRRRLG